MVDECNYDVANEDSKRRPASGSMIQIIGTPAAASLFLLDDTILSCCSIRSLEVEPSKNESLIPCTKTPAIVQQENSLAPHEASFSCHSTHSQSAWSDQQEQSSSLWDQSETDGVDMLSVLTETSICASHNPAATQGRLGMHRRSGMMKNSSMFSQDSAGLGWVLDGWVSTKATNNNSTPPARTLAHFSPHELTLGPVLRDDELFEYREVMNCDDEEHARDDTTSMSLRQSISSCWSFASEFASSESFDFTVEVRPHAQHSQKRKKRWMVKRLHKNWYATKKDAAACLAYEISLMKDLIHSNIQRVRGTVGQLGTGTFAILLDNPAVVLHDQLFHWKERRVRDRGMFGVIGRRFEELSALLTERLIVAYGIAKGMKFLHSRNVLHLGICPTSIACDHRGNAKIFDFSTATMSHEYAPGLKPSRPRVAYSAPEILQTCPPDTAADIYSFGILFWQIIALDYPYKKYGGDDGRLMHKIVSRGKRPSVAKLRSLPKELLAMTRATWSTTKTCRPQCKEICQLLGASISERRGMKQSAVGDQFAFQMDRSFSFCDPGGL